MSRLKISVPAGEQFNLRCTFKDGDGELLDLTGMTVTLKVNYKAKSTNLFTSSQSSITEPTTGVVFIPLSAANLTTVGEFECQLTLSKTDASAPNGEQILKTFVGDFIIARSI